ncbi:alpha/beta fold hydrolase [Streptomyces sp. IF17]|nr:alpha/beta fold hydrolase [Streptomyces alkaliphilus]
MMSMSSCGMPRASVGPGADVPARLPDRAPGARPRGGHPGRGRRAEFLAHPRRPGVRPRHSRHSRAGDQRVGSDREAPGSMRYESEQVATDGGVITVRRAGHDGPTLLFVHGMMVNGHVWDPLVEHLGDRYRVVLPDLPLGGHRTALAADADRSPGAHADRVLDLARTLPGPVVLVGNNTGGAIAQIAAVREPALFSRLVLLPSDAFDNCPPRLLTPLRPIAALPPLIRGICVGLRGRPFRRLLMKFVARNPVPHRQLAELLGALPHDRGVQRDLTGLLRTLRPEVTRKVVPRLGDYRGPVLIAWSRKDPLFPLAHAHRLAECFPNASVVIAERSRAFVSLDEPEWLATRLIEFMETEPAPETA